MLRYKCLVLDHDDTVAISTPSIHYPAFVKTLEIFRPEVKLSLEDFTMYCCDPGFSELCNDILKFTPEETMIHDRIWNDYVQNNIPKFYEGISSVIERQKKEGGLVCVVSLSNSVNILRDYKENCNFEPDLIFGWELGEGKIKPNPYPLNEIMRVYSLSSNELIMVDDLKPGYDMAKKCGVDFACAGWSLQTPKLIEYMKKNCDFYFDTVAKLKDFLFYED